MKIIKTANYKKLAEYSSEVISRILVDFVNKNMGAARIMQDMVDNFQYQVATEVMRRAIDQGIRGDVAVKLFNEQHGRDIRSFANEILSPPESLSDDSLEDQWSQGTYDKGLEDQWSQDSFEPPR
jgi:hypothetical protein